MRALREKVNESLSSVLPITAIVLVLSITAAPLLPGALLMLWAWYGLLSLALRRGAQTSLCTLAHADGERFVRPRWYVAAPLGLLLAAGMFLAFVSMLPGGAP